MVSCICKNCGNQFEKSKNEYNRKIKLGTPFYCSLSCSGKNNNKQLNQWTYSKQNKNHIKKYCNNKKDEMTPFRELFKRCKLRSKNNNKELEITLSDIKKQWELQKGKCPYLKENLILPLTTRKENTNNPNLIASIDRIDSSKGYVIGNIQIISRTLNYAKNKYDEEILLNLIDLIENRCYKY